MLVKYIVPNSLGPIGGLVKFTICAKVCHAEDRLSILFIGQMKFNIPQFSFCFDLFKVIPLTA